MKDSGLESTKALGNYLVMGEANILTGRKGKEIVQRELLLWAEKISRYKTKFLKEFEREKKTNLRGTGSASVHGLSRNIRRNT